MQLFSFYIISNQVGSKISISLNYTAREYHRVGAVNNLWWPMKMQLYVKALGPEQNGWHLASDTIRCIFIQ